jgi:type I restriction enzyme M protein
MINIKKIQDIMRKDHGVDGDAQRISQLVWLLFLKVFDDSEKVWEIENEEYKSPIKEELRWRNWAHGDENITGDELLNFIDNNLFKELKKLVVDDDKKALIIRNVFEDSFNYMKDGTLIKQVINEVDKINFNSTKDRHLFNDIYEKILKDLQSAGNAGEFYTPRALTEFIVDRVAPKFGEKVLDPACGTGGFLISAIEYLKKQKYSVEDLKSLEKNVEGRELKQLPHALATTNMMLHGIEEPNIVHDDSLSHSVRGISESKKFDCIVANPPFGGASKDGIVNNFPKEFQTKETADLFMVLMMKTLKENGRCGVVLPDGFLFGEGAKTRIKEELLKNFNLHTIVRLPNGVFKPYTGITTNLLFFDKCDEGTKEIWYYEHKYPKGYKSYNKTKPIKFSEFKTIQKWWDNRVENDQAWRVSFDDIKAKNYNLDFKNPHIKEEEKEYTSKELIEMLETSMSKSKDTLEEIKKELL